MHLLRRIGVFAAVAFGLALLGCDDPCLSLSKKICKCEKTQSLQQACTRRVQDLADSLGATHEQNNHCADLIDGCTCAKLADGDLAACGLTEHN